MKTFIWADMDRTARRNVLSRPAGLSDPALIASVRDIMDTVKTGGDEAVLDFTAKFDIVSLDNLRVPQEDLEAAWRALPEDQKNAINTARKNIKKFHRAQIPQDIEVETTKGVICRREARAIETAGLYVPGGTAPLISTLLMLAIPAEVAGVRHRIVVTPPGKDGKINPAILAAAHRCKVSAVLWRRASHCGIDLWNGNNPALR